ncbi:MAG TPA: Holliday junction branch migration protein RuvA [Dehalococcoidia bacterium]|nr:Holliday junction branch migration protein RuvA [Dehalococcoidia bacterium]
MIAGLEGLLKSLRDDRAIIDIHGISFRVQAPTSTLSVLGSPGDKVFLHTYLQVKEDNLSLYGFATTEELRMFELLIGVSGVGPKVALSLLSALSPERLSLAVASGNESVLSSISGVGKKTAARIILELKGKFEQVTTDIPYPHDDVKAALISLGYSAAEAMSATATLPNDPDLTLEDKIKLALKHFTKVG